MNTQRKQINLLVKWQDIYLLVGEGWAWKWILSEDFKLIQFTPDHNSKSISAFKKKGKQTGGGETRDEAEREEALT